MGHLGGEIIKKWKPSKIPFFEGFHFLMISHVTTHHSVAGPNTINATEAIFQFHPHSWEILHQTLAADTPLEVQNSAFRSDYSTSKDDLDWRIDFWYFNFIWFIKKLR